MSPLRKPRRKPEINIVPLIDVLTTLIFFFLMTMQFRDIRSLNITPPKMDSSGYNAVENSTSVHLSREGEFLFMGERVAKDALVARMKEAAQKGGEQAALLIVADENASVKDLAFLLDEGKKAPFKKIRMQTR